MSEVDEEVKREGEWYGSFEEDTEDVGNEVGLIYSKLEEEVSVGSVVP